MYKSPGLFQNIFVQESLLSSFALHSYFNHVIKYSKFGNKKYFLDGKRGVLSLLV